MTDKIFGMDVFGLLRLVREAGGSHRVGSLRDDTILADVVLPQERWEIEFLLDEEPVVEVFKSDGKILDAAALSDLIAKWSETKVPLEIRPAFVDQTFVDQKCVLQRLREAQICFLVDELRIRKMMIEGTIMIEAFLPGEQWEIDLLANGEIEVERFDSTGVRDFNADALRELTAMLADRRPLRGRKGSKMLL